MQLHSMILQGRSLLYQAIKCKHLVHAALMLLYHADVNLETKQVNMVQTALCASTATAAVPASSAEALCSVIMLANALQPAAQPLDFH